MPILKDATFCSFNATTPDWIKTPFGIKLVEDPEKTFQRLIDMEAYALAGTNIPEMDGESRKSINEWLKLLQNTNDSLNGLNPNGLADGNLFYTTPNYTDTRVGGNDVINPYWQFNRDDDIVPRSLLIDQTRKPGPGMTEGGMGRVYNETYNQNQQVLWLSMGVPEFNNLLSFYRNAGDSNAARLMNKGTVRGLTGQLITLLWKATVWAITFPIVAPFYIHRWLTSTQTTRITKYYSFKPAMTVYYEMVNTMLSYLAVSMGLYPQFIKQRQDSSKNLEKTYDLNEDTSAKTSADDIANTLRNRNMGDIGIPDLLAHGPDIFVILNRRARLFTKPTEIVTTRVLLTELKNDVQTDATKYYHAPNTPYETDDQGNSQPIVDDANVNTTQSWSKWWSSLKSTALGAGDYIGLKIEKTASFSETISNQSGPTAIAQKINAYAQQAKEQYDAGGGTVMGKVLTGIATSNLPETLTALLQEAIWNTAAAVGVGDIGAIMSAGNGFLDMPDVWTNSTFGRPYRFTIQLNARYADPVSVFQAIYIPLSMILCASMVRAVGDNMYTSPFVVKGYCKGMFSEPCGLIENVTISRGASEFGWSTDTLPTSINISMDIKSLSPTFFMSIQDIGITDTFSRNENLLEYLDTLSALGITERLYYWPKAMRKLSAALLIKRNTLISSTYWSAKIGRGNIARAIAAVSPFANHEMSDLEFKASQNP